MKSQGVTLAACTAFASVVSAWLPANRGLQPDLFSATGGKIRGVNLGSMFIMEPWMVSSEWNSMGCSQYDVNTPSGSQGSEFDCTGGLGQSQANSAFSTHRQNFLSQQDITNMVNYGLNTIRIPLGYWLFENLVEDGAHFPQGLMPDLENVCGWASDAGMYIILDMHGAPGAQDAYQPFTGQLAPTAAFYQNPTYYGLAYSFLQQLTSAIHNSSSGGSNPFRNVGTVEIINEPLTQQNAQTDDMRQTYYPAAIKQIRSTESSLGVAAGDALHVSMMDKLWGAGDPTQYTASLNDPALIYTDHNYEQYAAPLNQNNPGIQDYINYACQDDRTTDGETPKYVGEWSLAVQPSVQNDGNFQINSGNDPYYQKWFIAQIQQYEKTLGWIFWSWKTEGLNDPRWDYQLGVQNGLIPTNINNAIGQSVC